MTSFTLEQAFDQLTGVDAPLCAAGQDKELLTAEVEELAALRFGIVLTAKWESDPEEEPERRQELRVELADLRIRYFDKIDRIAMTFGVPIAMKVKDDVERRVALPFRTSPAGLPSAAGND